MRRRTLSAVMLLAFALQAWGQADAAETEHAAEQPAEVPAGEAAVVAPEEVVLPPQSDFVRDVRVLLALQDAAASGHGDAGGLQRRMIAQIMRERGLVNAAPERPAPDGAVLRAALAFTLSGGPPDIAEDFARLDTTPPPLRRLLNGAAAFKRGNKDEAAKLLGPIDALKLPPSTGGRVALVQAMLLPEANVAERLHLLDVAISLMPGTLIEEAALRRQAAIAGKAGLQGRLWVAGDRYVRRFRSSLYAPQFIASLTGVLIASEAAGKTIDRPRLDVMLGQLPLVPRRGAYLMVMRQALPAGLADLARIAAQRVRRLATEGSYEWQLAELYDAAFGLVGDEYEMSRRRLLAIDAAVLDDSDRELLASALALADRLRAGSDKSVITAAEFAKDIPPEHAALMARANQALQKADAALALPGGDSVQN